MILFLDVDGVLNNNDLILRDGAYALGTSQLQALKYLVDSTKCNIVLSSTWRVYAKCCDTLRKAFRELGIPEWVDVTPQLGYQPRCHEIREYMRGKVLKDLIIVDDDLDAFIKEAICIHTDYRVGLTMEQVEQCLEKLSVKS